MNGAILLTGATGVIGGASLAQLVRENEPAGIFLPVRSRYDAESLRRRGFRAWTSDIRDPSLGLSGRAKEEIVTETVAIIHCAADIRFSIALDESRATNVTGVSNLLTLARQCKYLEKFAHVSTVYAAGVTAGDVRERPLPRPAFLNTYQQAKWEAERAVLAAASDGVPAAIYRLSTVIGDSRDGKILRQNWFHKTLELAASNPFRLMPGAPDAAVDLIASDWTGAVLHRLVAQGFLTGGIFHVCGGPAHARTAQQVLDRAFAFLSRKQSHRLKVPRLVPPHVFEAYRSRFPQNSRTAVLWDALSHFWPQLAIKQRFHRECTDAALAGSAIVMPDTDVLLDKVFEQTLGHRVQSAREESELLA